MMFVCKVGKWLVRVDSVLCTTTDVGSPMGWMMMGMAGWGGGTGHLLGSVGALLTRFDPRRR